jgi:hypothetical protein
LNSGVPHLEGDAPRGKGLVLSSDECPLSLDASIGPFAGSIRGCLDDEVVNRVSKVSKAYMRRRKDNSNQVMMRNGHVSVQKAFEL